MRVRMPRSRKSIAWTWARSSQARTQRPQRMHLSMSRTMKGFESSLGSSREAPEGGAQGERSTPSS